MSSSALRRTYIPAAVTYGVVCQIGQILVLREFLVVFHGNEAVFGVVLAAWMLLVGVGSRLGAVLVRRARSQERILGYTSALAGVLLPATIVAARMLRAAFPVEPGAYLSIADMTVGALTVPAPLCITLGIQFIAVSRLARDAASTTSGVGRAYVGEALGNVAGGLLFTLVAVRLAGSLPTAMAAGVAIAGGGAIAVRAHVRMRREDQGGWYDRRSRGAGRPSGRSRIGFPAGGAPAVVAAAFVLVTIPFSQTFDRAAYAAQWTSFSPDHELIETRQSRYGTISIAARNDQISFFQSGNHVFSTAGGRDGSAGLEEQDAVVLAHVAMLQHTAPRAVLVVGGGLRGTLREIVRHPVESVEYVELDDVLTGAALEHAPAATRAALADPRVTLVHGDARFAVKRTDARYDVVLVDLPDPSTAVLNRYYTVEFFREARERLSERGVLVLTIGSTLDLRGLSVLNRNAAIYHSLASEFEQVIAAGHRTMILFAGPAGDAGLTADPGVLSARLADRGIAGDEFGRGHLEMLLLESDVRRLNWVLRTHGRSARAHVEPPRPAPLLPPALDEQSALEAGLPPVNRRYFLNSDMRPIGFYHTLVHWSVLTRGGHARVLGWVLRVEPWWVVVPAVGAIAAIVLVAGRSRSRRSVERYAVLTAVFTTGLSTMALQIALVFSFQSVYGFVYEMVGVIVAVFMAGLALGTAVIRRYVGDVADMRTLGALQLAIAVFSLLIAVVLPASAHIAAPVLVFAVFAIATFVAGVLNGADFPLTAACCLATEPRPGAASPHAVAGAHPAGASPERAGGAAYGTELFGACTGAIVAGVVIAPTVGVAACAVFAAIANTVSFIVLAIARRIS